MVHRLSSLVLVSICGVLFGQIPGDTAVNALVVSALPFATMGNSAAFTDDYVENCPFIAPGAPDVVYSFSPPQAVIVGVDLCGSSYDTKLYVYAGVAPPPGSGPTGQAIACSDDAGCGPNGWASRILNLALSGGTTYWIVVDGFGASPAGQSGAYTLSITSVVPPPPAPVVVGASKQLFLDGRFVASTSGVTLSANPPATVQENLMTADSPWEAAWTGGYSTVIQEGDTVHMWYEPGDASQQTRVAYAVSQDRGATWTKPSLGLVPFQGSTANNLVLGSVHGTHVFLNRQDAPPAERFCLFAGAPDQLFVSPDGLAWSPHGPQPFLNMGGQGGLDSQNVVFFDRETGTYLAFPRINVGGNQTRRVGRTVATDLTYGFPNPPAVVFSPDAQDPPDVDFYTSAAIRYPWAADAFVAFPALFHHGADTLDIGFGTSRDGVTWQRPTHAPVIALAPGSHSLYAGQGLTRDGNQIALYFTRYQAPHAGPYAFDGGIGRAIWRLDGFTSMDAGPTPGSFTTPPLIFSGTHLELNVACGVSGSVRVEVQNLAGQPLPGLAAADCVPLTGDAVAAVVHWSTTTLLDLLSGTPVVLRFEMQNAKLYAFQFPGPRLVFDHPFGPASLRIANHQGAPGNWYFTAVTVDPANAGLHAGQGWWAGLHVSLDELLGQFNSYAPPFLGLLDAQGGSSWTLPASVPASLFGTRVWGVTRVFHPLLPFFETGMSEVAVITL